MGVRPQLHFNDTRPIHLPLCGKYPPNGVGLLPGVNDLWQTGVSEWE